MTEALPEDGEDNHEYGDLLDGIEPPDEED